MKVKRFNNLWAMGLILCGVLLVAFYVAKIFFPEFIVGVAEIPSIIKFGDYVDNHKWAYYLFNLTIAILVYYFYCCACCRKKKLTYIELGIIIITNIVLFLIQEFIPEHYIYFNCVSLIFLPTIFCFINKKQEIKYMYSTLLCFSFQMIAPSLTLTIRDLYSLVSYPNSATFIILVIDVYIWLITLYNYYNYKEENKNG